VALNVIFREEAENDLTELALYIASQAGPAVANRYLDASIRRASGWRIFPSVADAATTSCRACARLVLSAERQSPSAFSKRGWRLSAWLTAGGISRTIWEKANRGAGISPAELRCQCIQFFTAACVDGFPARAKLN
jgi:hypothetical protein